MDVEKSQKKIIELLQKAVRNFARTKAIFAISMIFPKLRPIKNMIAIMLPGPCFHQIFTLNQLGQSRAFQEFLKNGQM